jgi:hypothetical protein
MILATGGNGSAEIMRVLSLAFAGRAGVPGKVRSDARQGRLKPRTIVVDPLPPEVDDGDEE